MKKYVFRSFIYLLILICYTFNNVYANTLKQNASISKTTKYQQQFSGITYYIHPMIGDDANSGTSISQPFQSLERIEKIQLHAGDKIILATGQTYYGSLKLIHQNGLPSTPIVITSSDWKKSGNTTQAIIDCKGKANGIVIQDCSHITVSHLSITGNGYSTFNEAADMRCAVLVNSIDQKEMTDINLDHLLIKDVFYENPGFIRNKNEVQTANGTQKYGWGIRIISNQENHVIENVEISNCEVSNVSHTGIKLTGNNKNIQRIKILHNKVLYTGGPGMQMSGVQNVYVADNIIDHSGSNNDSRKWGRGSGLWTWSSSDVLIERNRFLYANGPGDSDGAHIDFNCENIIIQYNLSAFNAGGFCEILGNNYNCTYRYNVSVNDGYRIKGKDGAFQEGKTLWLSGYQGNHQPRKGPVNTYIYNNTIYADASLQPKIAFDNTSKGVVIANNIFCVANPFQLVLGDQYKPDVKSKKPIENMQITNNLFLNPNSLPGEMGIYEHGSLLGDPKFKKGGGLELADYIPLDTVNVKHKGISVHTKEIKGFDSSFSSDIKSDIMGNTIPAQLSIGAIEPVF